MARAVLIDETGRRYGRLMVVARDEDAPPRGGAKWLCRCDCGAERSIEGKRLRSGQQVSCGCQKLKHGRCSGRRIAPVWTIWSGIRQRCTNPKAPAFPRYGGRGVTMCERWRSFAAFLADVGERPSPGHSIDRIDNDRGYEPGNVRWATDTEQNRNRRDNRRVEFRGENLTLGEWAERTGIRYSTLRRRIAELRWPTERALTEPIREHRPYRGGRHAA